MKMKVMSGPIIALTLLAVSVAEASEVEEKLFVWRDHILSKGNFAGVELGADHYASLVRMGPNILPVVMSAYAQETDPHVLYYYAILIHSVSHFSFFRYSDTPLSIHGYEYQAVEEIPFLSERIGKNSARHPESTLLKKKKLVQWWGERHSFLQRAGIEEKIRRITGDNSEKYLQYNKAKARQLCRLGVYGIYNIPCYLDIINADNNPIIFCEFLRISNCAVYTELPLTGDVVSNSWLVNDRFPTRQEKIDLICTWWETASETFSRLEDLHGAIEGRVQAMCTRGSK